jgi:hypothetical protein
MGCRLILKQEDINLGVNASGVNAISRLFIFLQRETVSTPVLLV